MIPQSPIGNSREVHSKAWIGNDKRWLEMTSHLTGRCLVLFWIMSPRASMALSSIETMAGSAVMMSRTGVRSGGMSNAITRLIHEIVETRRLQTSYSGLFSF